MFFMQIIEAFLVRTEPASSMVNPAAIHMTSAPQTRNAKVLRMNAVSSFTSAARATAGWARKRMIAAIPDTAMMTGGRLYESIVVRVFMAASSQSGSCGRAGTSTRNPQRFTRSPRILQRTRSNRPAVRVHPLAIAEAVYAPEPYRTRDGLFGCVMAGARR